VCFVCGCVCVCVCVCVCMFSPLCVEVNADAVVATDELQILQHLQLVPQSWINAYPRAVAIGMRCES